MSVSRNMRGERRQKERKTKKSIKHRTRFCIVFRCVYLLSSPSLPPIPRASDRRLTIFAFISDFSVMLGHWCGFQLHSTFRFADRSEICGAWFSSTENENERIFLFHFATLTLSRIAHPKRDKWDPINDCHNIPKFIPLHFSSFHRRSISFAFILHLSWATERMRLPRECVFFFFFAVSSHFTFSLIKYFNFLPSFVATSRGRLQCIWSSFVRDATADEQKTLDRRTKWMRENQNNFLFGSFVEKAIRCYVVRVKSPKNAPKMQCAGHRHMFRREKYMI